ncbi:MAG TPA: ASCH domain-containing protein, partial [Chitinophagales bacterium]|nr:ASCH domain-containing protein [Chitinophagales bacterium]
DFYGEAKCIVRTINIDIVEYNMVTADFAFKEGEGDQSLQYWQEVHWKYFENYLKLFNKPMTEDALLVCEEFELIHH